MRRILATTASAIVLVTAGLVHFTLPAHSQDARFTQFTGNWFTHGGVLYIGPHGVGFYQLRTYVFCTNSILTDCDRVKGNNIYPGAYGAFKLTSVTGNTAKGVITDSSTSWEIHTLISFTRSSSDYLAGKGASDYLGRSRFCGPHAPAGTCGA